MNNTDIPDLRGIVATTPAPDLWAIVGLTPMDEYGNRDAYYIHKSPDSVGCDVFIECSTSDDGDDLSWSKDKPPGVYRITVSPRGGEDWYEMNVVAAELLYSLEPSAPRGGTFQDRNDAWMAVCFQDDPTDLPERTARYGEESLELLQAAGMTKDQVLQLVDYVFARPVGEPGQEMGGALTCLAGLATYLRLDMMACGERELQRVSTPEMRAKIRGKRSRRHGRGPLPGTSEIIAGSITADSIPSGDALVEERDRLLAELPVDSIDPDREHRIRVINQELNRRGVKAEADLVPRQMAKPYRQPFIGLPLSDGTMI